MSTCDPNSPVACEKCRNPQVELPLAPTPTRVSREELEDMATRLKAIRLEARGLARSGNPAVRAEGKAAVAHCDDQLAWIRAELSKEDE